MNGIESAGVVQGPLPREFLGYAFASAAALGVDAGLLYFLAHYAHWNPHVAAPLTFTVGAFVAYALSIKLAFHNHRLRRRWLELLTFVALGAAGLAVNSLAIFIAIAKLGLAVLPAKVIAAGCTFVTNFIVRRQLLFTPAASGTRS